jgi:NADP-reducing hydrogenase subunit HndC
MTAYRSMILVSNDEMSRKNGAGEVFQAFQAALNAQKLESEVKLATFVDPDLPESLPVVIVYPDAVAYGPVKPADADRIVSDHMGKGEVVCDLQVSQKDIVARLGWLASRKGYLPAEHRIVLRRAGIIDPASIDEYILHDGYQALAKVLSTMSPQDVITELERSGLRGRGGAGFPTGTKWKFVAKTQGEIKYVVCNADESEPGTFKDRLVLEGDPHAIIEAVIIAGYAVGAQEGYIYIRGEYVLARQRLDRAIQQAREHGFLGENIFGHGFSFEIHTHSGAGAYICGEETALIESIEGKRGEPRSRPPYPTTNGLWDRPTVVNNVETLANVPPILLHGADWYRKLGTSSSPGTKVFTIMGNVNVTGVIEVPMGITLREILDIYAKGMKPGFTLKLVQTGGSSGTVVPATSQDAVLDFDSFGKFGVSLGSGAMLFCDENTCVVDLARVLLNFFRNEGCGKCSPCRVGTQRAYQILENISKGCSTLKDLDDLQMLSENLYEMSNCGLGQTAGTPLRDILKYFRPEVETHVTLKVCPVGATPMTGCSHNT